MSPSNGSVQVTMITQVNITIEFKYLGLELKTLFNNKAIEVARGNNEP